MSGSPKYTRAELEQRRQAELERKRREKAERAARRRQEQEARERQRRVNARRQQVQQQHKALQTSLTAQQNAIYDHARNDLATRLNQQQKAIQSASSEAQLQTIATALEQLEQELQGAIAQKRRDDEAKKRQAELDRQRFLLQELRQQWQQIPDAEEFDMAGHQAVHRALAAVEKAIAQGNPAPVRQPLQDAEQALTQHQQQVQTQRAAWQQRKATAETQLGELQTLVAGLQDDPVVMQWQGAEVAQMQGQVQEAERAIAQEQFEQVGTVLQASQHQGQVILETANAAQLQADQRDYIADSIAHSLNALGFTVVSRQAEHPDHPASAIVLGAVTHAGKGISVSVPVEGEVFYDVEGYPKQTEAAIGGGAAATCDAAEQVIGEMHGILAEQFGIQMGELQWEDKDPHRKLRQADELPRQSSGRQAAVRR